MVRFLLFRHLEPDEAGEGVAVNVADFGNLVLGHSDCPEFRDEVALAVEFVLFHGGLATLRSAERDAFRLPAGERFLCPLTDEVALDFGGQTEGKGENLALDVLAEAVVVLDCPDFAFAGHADVQNLHNHEKVPAEPRQLRADYQVVLLNPLQQLPELPLAVGLRAADGLLNPAVDVQVLTRTEIGNLKPLVLDGLLVAAHSDVSINHCSNLYKLHDPEQDENRVCTANFRTNPNIVNGKSKIYRFLYESFSLFIDFFTVVTFGGSRHILQRLYGINVKSYAVCNYFR